MKYFYMILIYVARGTPCEMLRAAVARPVRILPRVGTRLRRQGILCIDPLQNVTSGSPPGVGPGDSRPIPEPAIPEYQILICI